MCRHIVWVVGVTLLLTSCDDAPSPPRMVTIELASGTKSTPYSPEELADPGIQSVIAECERQGGLNCQERTGPGNARTQFVQGQDDEVITHVTLGESNRTRSTWLAGGYLILMADSEHEIRSLSKFLRNSSQTKPCCMDFVGNRRTRPHGS